MGAFTLTRSKKGPASLQPPPGAPVVRVIGDAYMGAVTVQVKVPREKVMDRLTRKILDR